MSKIIFLTGWAMPKDIIKVLDLEKNFDILYTSYSDYNSINEYIVALKNMIKEEKVFLIGWSLGSLVGMRLCVEDNENIEGIILISPTVKFIKDKKIDNKGWSKLAIQKMMDSLLKDKESIIHAFMDNMINTEHIEFKNLYYENQSVEKLNIGLEYLMNEDLYEKIKQIDVKVLLIHGTKDKICPFEQSEYIAKIVNKSNIHLLDSSHIPFFTHKDKCLELITNFIEQE